MVNSNPNIQQEVIGLIPAGGQATRISPLAGSKELYPVGFRTVDDGSLRPKVVCHYLLEKMRFAGIRRAYFVLRSGKWDIPTYWEDGTLVDMNLGYLVVRLPYGVPYTLDAAYSFVQNSVVALGFPDILFQPDDVYRRLLAHLSDSHADVVLGVVWVEQPDKSGMVDIDEAGSVRLIVEKPKQSDLCYSWFTAAWMPSFTEFLHQYLIGIELPAQEVMLADVMQAAIASGLKVEVEIFENGSFLDVGTPEGLVQAVRQSVEDISNQLG